ncbi:hypothetical protein BH18ACT16_BH18ACT16_03570 [soil metagenome]
MEYRALGRTGTMVSELCLGCMTFGRELDDKGSKELIDLFIDAGGNFLDTADVYSQGSSEEITGKAVQDKRDDLVIATKVRFPMGDGLNDVGISRKHIMAGAEASLRRLGTDYIDLYQVHCWDAITPLEETLSALTDLVRQGKVRYIGISNFSGWQIMKAMSVSRDYGFESFVSLQPQYSLVERNLEYELVPVCLDQGIGILPWGPLGGGFVSGKYRRASSRPKTPALRGRAPTWRSHGSGGRTSATGKSSTFLDRSPRRPASPTRRWRSTGSSTSPALPRPSSGRESSTSWRTTSERPGGNSTTSIYNN